MNSIPLLDRISIYDLLCKFQSTFDLQDWKHMEECLWEQLYVDYSSFRNEAPGLMMSKDYVALRQVALEGLKMQHNFSNLVLNVDGNNASARCNYQILRFRTTDCRYEIDFFHSYGRYIFDLSKRNREWRISGICQELISNHGNTSLHQAILKKNP